MNPLYFSFEKAMSYLYPYLHLSVGIRLKKELKNMATLNAFRVLSEYNLILKYHDSRPPSDLVAGKLGASLFEARRVSAMARTQLIQAINTGAGSALVKEILEYH
jgi:hypothetical protein